jgi:predicted nuclease of predicted toxin-antitoxin system
MLILKNQLIDFLRKNNVDVKWVTEVNMQMSDEQIIEMANKEERIILTNDKDFGELTFLKGEISKGILLLRVKGQDVNNKIALLRILLKKYSDKLENHFTVVKTNKFRFIKIATI